jgi:putative ABC transport system permease protein
MAEGYGSAEEVWDALREEEGLAVVDSFVVPRRSNFGFAVLPDFQLSGFYAEDRTFDPVPVRVRHPQSGIAVDVRVIAVLEDSAPLEMAGIMTSADTLQPFGQHAQPTTHFIEVSPGVDPEATAAQLERSFLGNGMEADAFTDLLDEAVGASLTFQRLVMGFMGLGLVVGVAALGVIGARAVVERRQQIGVLRSIGFRPGMVRLSFLLEAGVLAGSAILIGALLGLILAANVVQDSSEQPAWDHLTLQVPTANLVVVFTTVFLAALAATYAPALRASRIYPAEALRYE